VVDADEIVGRVRALLVGGLHRDQVLGLTGEGLAGGGMFRGDRGIYYRGTAEFVTAHSEGLLDRLPPAPPPASLASILEVELLVGSPLPDLLKSLYALANGGFGPGYGLLGLRGGYADDMHL
jgi:hypothetical protein